MKAILDCFKECDKRESIVGFNSELKSMYMDYYYHNNNKSILYVSSSLFEANKIYQSLQNYNANVLLFPMDDFLTSEALAISPELKITRLETINELIYNQSPHIVVTNLMGFLRFLPTKKIYKKSIINLKVNDDVMFNDLVSRLLAIGYQKESVVSKTGEIAVRGYVIDIFPVSFKNPIRMEFWGDNLDSIREFNIDSQLTVNNRKSVEIYPNSESILENFTDDAVTVHRMIKNYGGAENIFAYFSDGIVFYDNYEQIKNSYDQLQNEIFEYNVSNENTTNTQYMFNLEELDKLPHRYFDNFDNTLNESSMKNYKALELDKINGGISNIDLVLKKYLLNKKMVLLCVSNKFEVNKLLDNLNVTSIFTNESELFDDRVNIILKNIKRGFILNDLVVFSEYELFDKSEIPSSYKTKFKIGTKIANINKLSLGDYVVHSIHGIGRYAGIKTLEKNGLKKDYLQIEYKDNDKLYIPVEKIELLTKYSQADGIPPKINK